MTGQFGNTLLSRPGSTAGRVIADLNGDGKFDAGEPGAAGRQVYLDVNGNGARDGNEPTRTTDSSGAYAFDPMGPGTYTVREVVPTGWRQTVPTDDAAHVATLGVGQRLSDRSFDTAPTFTPALVVGRHVFYNNASPGAAAPGDPSVGDKRPLLPGQSATFANISAYDRGINGLIIDVSNLPAGVTAADFLFRVGSSPTPAAWKPAPVPSVTITPDAGEGGSDRVTLVWPDGALKNVWLQVTVLPNERTGLIAPDVFYFGSLVGETGDHTTSAAVDARDVAGVLRNFGTVASRAARDRYDVNRDGKVDARDLLIVRSNQRHSLPLLNAPVVAAASVATTPAASRTPASRRGEFVSAAVGIIT
jgi:hypothetical protein